MGVRDHGAPGRPATLRCVLALVPSSLLIGVTAHISTDVAAVPLLWVVPLALYLLAFIDAFAVPSLVPAAMVGAARHGGDRRRARRPGRRPAVADGAGAAPGRLRRAGAGVPRTGGRIRTARLTATSCSSPPQHPRRVFDALVAPQVFTQDRRCPVMLALAAVLQPAGWRDARLEPLALRRRRAPSSSQRCIDRGRNGLVRSSCWRRWPSRWWSRWRWSPATAAPDSRSPWRSRRPRTWRCRASTTGASSTRPAASSGCIGSSRTMRRTMHRLLHGATLHGWEKLGSDRCEPTSYYHPDGPVGQLFRLGTSAPARSRSSGLARVG